MLAIKINNPEIENRFKEYASQHKKDDTKSYIHTDDDWSYLESEIDKGFNSGVSQKTHEEIIADIKRKYA